MPNLLASFVTGDELPLDIEEALYYQTNSDPPDSATLFESKQLTDMFLFCLCRTLQLSPTGL